MGELIVLAGMSVVAMVCFAAMHIKDGDREAWSRDKLLDILTEQVRENREETRESRNADFEVIGDMVRKIMYGFAPEEVKVIEEELRKEGFVPVNEEQEAEDWFRRNLQLVPSPPTAEELRQFVPHEDDAFMDDDKAVEDEEGTV